MADAMVSQLLGIQETFKQKLLARDTQAMSVITGRYGSLVNDFAKQIEDMANDPNLTPSKVDQLKRLRLLQKQMQDRLTGFTADTTNVIKDVQKGAIDLASKQAESSARAQTPSDDATVLASFNMLPAAAINEMVGTMSDGSPIQDTLTNIFGDPHFNQQVAGRMLAGLARGENPRKTAKALKELYGGRLGRVLTVTRTESQRAYRDSSASIYDQNEDIIEGWYWYAAIGKSKFRTCASCLAMHGKFFPLKSDNGRTPKQDGHPNCRCTMVPKLKGRDWNIKSGEEIFSESPEYQQDQLLGKEAAAMVRKGDLLLSDFVKRTSNPRWGTMRRPGNLQSALENAAVRKGLEPLTPDALSNKMWGEGNLPKATFTQRMLKDAEKMAGIQKIMQAGNLTIDDIAPLVGAPAGAKVEIYTLKAKTPHSPRPIFFARVDHEWYEQERSFTTDENGKLVITNESFERKPGAPAGLGARILKRQALEMHARGIDNIKTYAAGAGGMPGEHYNGYYTWAALGFDGEANLYFDKIKEFSKAHGNITKVQEFMDAPGGREFWKKNGFEFEGNFDTKPGSKSMKRLDDYLKEKGFSVPAPGRGSEPQAIQAPPGGYVYPDGADEATRKKIRAYYQKHGTYPPGLGPKPPEPITPPVVHPKPPVEPPKPPVVKPPVITPPVVDPSLRRPGETDEEYKKRRKKERAAARKDPEKAAPKPPTPPTPPRVEPSAPSADTEHDHFKSKLAKTSYPTHKKVAMEDIFVQSKRLREELKNTPEGGFTAEHLARVKRIGENFLDNHVDEILASDGMTRANDVQRILAIYREMGHPINIKLPPGRTKLSPLEGSMQTHVAKYYPKSWVKAGNAEELKFTRDSGRAGYRAANKRKYRDRDGNMVSFGEDPNITTDNASKSPYWNSTGVHEYGHHMEQTVKHLAKSEAIFYDQRTAGEPLQKLSDLTGISAYREWETARRDNFQDSYMGKDYRDVRNGDASSWELFTMGYEGLLHMARHREDLIGDGDFANYLTGLLLTLGDES